MKSTCFASLVTLVTAQSQMVQTNGGPQFKVEWDEGKKMFKLNAEVPNKMNLDLIFNSVKSSGADVVEFNASNISGLVLDRNVEPNGNLRVDIYNQYQDVSIIKQNGVYNFQAYRPAKADFRFGLMDSDIECGQKNEYLWEVHNSFRT